VFVFQLKSEAPSKAVERPEGYFANNAAAMKKEWSGALEKIRDINSRINGILNGKESSMAELASAIDGLKKYVDGTKFLKNDSSLTDALWQLKTQADAASGMQSTSALIENFVVMESRSKYFQMKLDAYIVLADMMADVKAGKLAEAQRKLGDGRKISGVSYSDVFLGALNSDVVDYGFNKAVKAEDAKKAAVFCEIMQKEIQDIPLWAAGIQLPEVQVVGMEHETTLGKALGYIPVIGPIRDIIKGTIKLCDKNPNNDTYGGILIGVGGAGILMDCASLVTFGGASIAKAAARKVTLAGAAKWSKSYLTRKATITMAEEFTTKELKNITKETMENVAKNIARDELPLAISKDVARVASGDLGQKVVVENIVKDMVQNVVEKLFEKTGKRMTKEQLERIVARETESLTGSIMADMAGKEFGEEVLRAAIRRQFNSKAVKSIATKVSEAVTEVTIANEANLAKFAGKNLMYGPMAKRMEEAAKIIADPAWLKEICKVAVKKGKIVAPDELMPAFEKGLKEAFAKAFKDVPKEILEKAGMTSKIDDILKAVVEKVNAKKGIINSALLESLAKDEIAAGTKVITGAVDAEVRNAIITQATATALANTTEGLIKNASRDGAKELTDAVQDQIFMQLKTAGFDDAAIAGLRAEGMPALQKIVEEQAALVVKKASGGSLTAASADLLKGSLEYDLELAGRNAGALGKAVIWPSWMMAKGPRYGGGVAGSAIGDAFKGIAKTTSPWRTDVGKRIMLTDITYVGAARVLHGGAEAANAWLLSKPKKLPMKYAEVLPGSEAIDVILTSAFRNTPMNGIVYYKLDGGELMSLKVKDGKVRSDPPLAFGRHRIELSLSKDMSDRSIVLLDIKPPYFDYENGAVVLYKPNGARLAGAALVLKDAQGKETKCKTTENGSMAFAPAEGTQYEVTMKNVMLGKFMLVNGKVVTEAPAAAQASQQQSAPASDAQQQFNAILGYAEGTYGAACNVIRSNTSMSAPLASAVAKVKGSGASDEEAAKAVVNYLDKLGTGRMAEWPAQLSAITANGMVTQKYIDGLGLNAGQKTLVADINKSGLGDAFLGKVNYLVLQGGDSFQQAVLNALESYDKKKPAESLKIY